MTEHFDVSLGGIEQSQQQLDGRRFARAVRAEQAEHLARPDLEIHIIHRPGFGPAPEVFEHFRQPADDDDIFRRWRVAGCRLRSFLFQGNHSREKIKTTRFAASPQASAALSRNDAVEDGERGRLDRTRRRPADGLAALALTLQTVSGICRTNCSARRRTERPGRSRSPFPTASFRLRTRAKTTSDFGTISPSPRPSPIGWERENRPPSVGVSNRFGCCERRVWLFPLPSDGRGSG